jgi:Flp pilus assembly pilin Flp
VPRLRAQNIVEYGMMMGTIGLVVLIGVVNLGNLIAPWYTALAQHITTLGT